MAYSKIWTILPVAIGLLAGGCSSNVSVGNYLWGDDPAPQAAKTGQQAVVNAPVTGLTKAPDVAAIRYNASQPSISAANSTRLAEPPKNSQRVYVIVNDEPITGYDILQRARLNDALGYARGTGPAQRKRALRELIDDVIKISEVKRSKVPISDRQVDASIQRMSKSTGLTPDALKAKLAKRGIAFSALKRQIRSSLAMRWLLRSKGQGKVSVSEAEIDKRLAAINRDPRRQGVTVYSLRMVVLPVDKTSPAMTPQLFAARAAESQQIARRYKGCASLRRASSGIYNVKIGRRIDADGRKLPAQMKQALRRAGTRRLIGPMRSAQGIQLIAYCGKRRIEPPKANRAQVKNILLNEKFAQASERVMRDLRRRAFIDYKVASARP